MMNKDYIEQCKHSARVRTNFQKDALDWLKKSNRALENAASYIPRMADEIVNCDPKSDFENTFMVIKKLKNTIPLLCNIVNNSPYFNNKTEDEFEYEIDFPITLEQDKDGFYFVKFDFDLPVIRKPFDSNERFNLRRCIQKLDTPDTLFNQLFVCYEFHQGTSNKTIDAKEIGNRDVKLITDLLVSKYSKNGDNKNNYSELKQCVLDENYYTKAYIMEQKDAMEFLKKHC